MSCPRERGQRWGNRIFGVEQQVLACDCAGLDAPVVATGLLGVDFRQVFASDVNPNAVKWLEALGHAEVLHGDILERPISMPPDGVDGYVAGFPCQPFSRQGCRAAGFEDHRTRVLDIYSRSLFPESPIPLN